MVNYFALPAALPIAAEPLPIMSLPAALPVGAVPDEPMSLPVAGGGGGVAGCIAAIAALFIYCRADPR